MAGQSVTICGLARDCAARLPGMMLQLEQLGELFQSYEVIVVENDSSDNTGDLLDSWSGVNPKVKTIRFSFIKEAKPAQTKLEDGPGWFQADRIQRICFARNIYLAELAACQTDYVIVVDLDLLRISLNGIATSFASPNHWQSVASNGLRYTLRAPFRPYVYWDTYAFEPVDGFMNNTQTLQGIRQSQKDLERQLCKDEWQVAKSAFGGLCIYRADVLAGVEYTVLPNSDVDVPLLCEHIGLHREICQRNALFRVQINPSQLVTYETVASTIKRSLSDAMARYWR